MWHLSKHHNIVHPINVTMADSGVEIKFGNVKYEELNEAQWRQFLVSFIKDIQRSIDISRSESKEVKETLTALKDSISFAADKAQSAIDKITPLHQKVALLERDLEQSNRQNTELKLQIRQVEQRCIKIEGQSRRNNLLIDGLEEHPGEKCEEVVKTFFQNTMNMTSVMDIKLVRVHRLGNPNRGPNSKPRSMIVKFHFYQDRERVWNNRKNLKGKPFYLDEDFPEEIRNARHQLMPIMFAARRDGKRAIISVDRLIVDGKSYSLDQIKKLPESHELRPERIATPSIDDKTVAFFTAASPLSNFYQSKFVVDGVEFHSNEQYYRVSEATFVGDQETARKIMDAPTASRCKQIGRSIKGDLTKWLTDGEAMKAMTKGLLHKFSQNVKLKAFLLATQNKSLVEANPNDIFWGAGVSIQETHLLADPMKWLGRNQLGTALQNVREKLSNE